MQPVLDSVSPVDLQFLAQQVVNGLTAGAQIALMACGLALIFGVVNVVNFAQGELFMLAAYLLYYGQISLRLPYPIAAILALVAMLVVGALFYVLVIHRVFRRGWQVQLVATLATAIVLANSANVIAGSLPVTVSNELTDGVWTVGFLHLAPQRVLVIVVTGIALGLLWWFLGFTRLGRAMRAVAQNREAAVRLGVNPEWIGFVTVVVATMLAGVAAVTVAPLYNVSPTMGADMTLYAFAAVIVGGMGNVTGAVVAGFILGLAQALGIGYISSAYGSGVVFALMIAILLLKPDGLLGQQVRL